MLNRIQIKRLVENLKNGNENYDQAIDDAIKIIMKKPVLYKIVHTKTELFFNGYDKHPNSTKGKNTLSLNNSQKFLDTGESDEKLIEKAFGRNITLRDKVKYIYNHIVYSGSEIHIMLSKYYSTYDFIPISDFHVLKDEVK